jgi:hypothetical protein
VDTHIQRFAIKSGLFSRGLVRGGQHTARAPTESHEPNVSYRQVVPAGHTTNGKQSARDNNNNSNKQTTTHLSSSQGWEQPDTTMFGRKRFMGTGELPLARMRLFKSAKLSVVVMRNGCPSANDTTSDTGTSVGFSDFHLAVMFRVHVCGKNPHHTAPPHPVRLTNLRIVLKHEAHGDF